MKISKVDNLRYSILLSNRQITINLLLFCLFVAILFGLIRLGVWQYERSLEKQRLIDQYNANVEQPYQALQANIIDIKDYQNVAVAGQLSDLTVYVANESYKGRDGYHVLNAIIIDSQYLLWVNRGWIAATGDRRQLPEVELPPVNWQVKGQAYYSKGKPILFDHALQQVDQHRWLIQGLDYQLLSTVKQTGQLEVLPYIIRLADDQAHGFARQWSFITATPPAKHLAYSVQWFGLALAWTILMFFVTIKRRVP